MWRMHDAGDQACHRLLKCGRCVLSCLLISLEGLGDILQGPADDVKHSTY